MTAESTTTTTTTTTKSKSSGRQLRIRPEVDAQGMLLSYPLNRNGLYTSARLEDKYRRRIDRLEHAPPKKLARRMQVLTHVLMFGTGAYIVLYKNFGTHEHCFSGLRRWYFKKVDS
ncbi:hypothetical protein EV175_006516, partial [Coemansia sp. RSA 1933]